MKRHAFWGVLVVLGLLAPLALLLLSCGSGGGSGTSGTSAGSGGSSPPGTSGTVSVAITDAKPRLPAEAAHVFVTFDEVSVHKAGGGWITLPVVAPAPHTIDLLQFSDGNTTQLVPPVRLDSGKYTQLRLGVTSASIVFDDGTEQALEVPSDSLKTAKDFNFEVHGGGAVDLVVDFDLSKSIVVTGSHKYKLKPVLHIVQTFEAAEIKGSIPAGAFGSSTEPAIVTVWWDKDTSCSLDENVDEIYTQIEVPKADPAADFDIFWLVPNEAYIVQIDVGGNTFFFTVPGVSNGVCQTLPPSAVFHLELATIQGTIPADAFGTPPIPATATVYVDTQPNCKLDASDEQYTTPLQVPVNNPTFSIPVFPDQAYILKIEVNGNTFVYAVPGPSGSGCQKLAPDEIFNLAPATINGSIAAATFGSSSQASVTVYLDKDSSGTVTAGDLVYTTITVLKATPNFSVSVFPAQDYVVRVVAGSTTKDVPVTANQVPSGATFTLNGGTAI